MPSNTTLDGAKNTKPGTYVTIHWNKNMLFNGKFAEFHGGVQANQDTAYLKCLNLQVTLDRYISFKEGQKENQKASVEKMVCDQKVYMEDKITSPDGKVESWRVAEGTLLELDNVDSQAKLRGIGKVKGITRGAADISLAPPPAGGQAAPKGETKLWFTRVDFDGRMFGSNKPGLRLAVFYDNVEVYREPGDNPHMQVTPNKPGKDGFYLRCHKLSVATQERDGISKQVMVAKTNVFFRTPEFFGNADEVKYDEGEETIIFEGNPTTLFKLGAPGAKPQRIEGKKILYNRRTGKFEGAGVNSISASLEPERSKVVHSLRERTFVNSRSELTTLLVAGLDADREDEPFLGLGLHARDDGQELTAHGPVDDLALVGRRDRQADLVVLVRPVLDDDLGRLVVHEREGRLLVGRQ
jgi:lipopolysaccharide export system protein LptA